MKKITTTDRYYTPYQLKLPLEISKKIKISDPVYTFCEVFDHIDLNKHLVAAVLPIGWSGVKTGTFNPGFKSVDAYSKFGSNFL